MLQPSNARRAVSLLALVFASGFANVSLSHAQDHPPEATSTAVPQATGASQNGVQILSPTNGVDFKPYLNALVQQVRRKWYASMPEAALKGEKGEAIVRFRIESNGNAEGVVLETSSGKDVFDEAAIQAIRDSGRFQPLPQTFKGPSLSPRFIFIYNVRPAPEERLPRLRIVATSRMQHRQNLRSIAWSCSRSLLTRLITPMRSKPSAAVESTSTPMRARSKFFNSMVCQPRL